MRTVLFLAIGACAIVACSTESANGDAPATTNTDAGADGSSTDAPSPPRGELPYPSGPYGAAVGDVMADFRVQGYALSRTQNDSTKLPFRDVTLGEVRSDPACQCLVVMWNAAGLTCQPCFNAGAAIASAIATDPTMCGMEIIQFSYDNYVDGQPVSSPTRADLDAFVQASRPPMPVGLVTTGAIESLSAGSLPGIPDAWVVRPSDMRIVGFIPGLPFSLATTAKALCASPSSPVETIATGIDPRAMVLGEPHVYFTDAQRGLVRMPINGGSAMEILDTASGAVADRLVFDGVNAYWSTEGSPSTVRRTPIAGGLSEIVATLPAAVSSLAASGGEVIVATNDGAIRAYPGARTIATGEADPTSLVAHGSMLLWVDRDTGEVLRSGLDGSNRTVIGKPDWMPGGAKPEQVLVRNPDVVIRGRSKTRSVIALASFDGGFATMVTGSFSIPLMAISNGTFWHTHRGDPAGDDGIGRVVLQPQNEPGTAGAVDLIVGQHLVESIAIDNGGVVYWTTRPHEGEPANGTLRRRRP